MTLSSPMPSSPLPSRWPDTEPILDPQSLARLIELDPQGTNLLFVRVLGTYRKSLGRYTAQLAAARQPFDANALRQAAHTLKSSSGSVGALLLAQLCGSAEAALREGRFDEVTPIVDALLAEAARVDQAVNLLLPPS